MGERSRRWTAGTFRWRWLSAAPSLVVGALVSTVINYFTDGSPGLWTTLFLTVSLMTAVLVSAFEERGREKQREDTGAGARAQCLIPTRSERQRGPLSLLEPHVCPVRFHGRSSELKALKTWLADSDDGGLIAVVSGTRGTGKTRLALEVLRGLSPEWDAGWMSLAGPSDTQLERMRESRRPCLVIVDQFEKRRDRDRLIIDHISLRSRPFRLLILTRDFETVTSAIEAPSEAIAPPRILHLHLTEEKEVGDRVRYFNIALPSFGLALEAPVPAKRHDDHVRVGGEPEPLVDVLARALATAFAFRQSGLLPSAYRGMSVARVTDALVTREKSWWLDRQASYGIDPLPDGAIDEAAAALSVLPRHDEQSTIRNLRVMPRLGRRSSAELARIASLFDLMYAVDEHGRVDLGSQELREWLLTEVFSRAQLGELCPILAGHRGVRDVFFRDVLTCAADRMRAAAAFVVRILGEDATLLDAVLRSAGTTRCSDAVLDQGLASMVRRSKSRFDASEHLASELELVHTQHAIRKLVCDKTRRDADAGRLRPVDLALAIYRRGHSLMRLGRTDRARTELVRACRMLRDARAEEDPGTLRGFVDAHRELAQAHHDLAEYDKALQSAEEAAQAAAGAGLGKHATAQLAAQVAELHWHVDPEAAGPGIEDAIVFLRELVDLCGPHHRVDLATSLAVRGNCLESQDDPAGALASVNEALVLSAEAAHRSDLASDQLTLRLTTARARLCKRLDDGAAANSAYVESVALARRLSRSQPARYTPRLAEMLEKLGDSYQAQGNLIQSEAHHQEAVSIFRRLTAAKPSRYALPLAHALCLLSKDYSASEDPRSRSTRLEALKLYAAHERLLSFHDHEMFAWVTVAHALSEHDRGAARGGHRYFRLSVDRYHALLEVSGHSLYHHGKARIDLAHALCHLGEHDDELGHVRAGVAELREAEASDTAHRDDALREVETALRRLRSHGHTDAIVVGDIVGSVAASSVTAP